MSEETDHVGGVMGTFKSKKMCLRERKSTKVKASNLKDGKACLPPWKILSVFATTNNTYT